MTKRLIAITSLACALVAAAIVYGQDNAADTAKLIEVLQLKPGSIVGEIGAGNGDLTIALAKHVGPTGRVYSSELGDDRLKGLRAAVVKSGATNIEVIEGQAAHANLSEGCCDAIFMRNVYHHFGDPPSMNASFLKALKPGGRLAVIDFYPRRMGRGGDTAASPPATAPPGKRGEEGSHGVGTDVVANELKAAGFQILSSEDRKDRWFIVVAAKP
jgi:ubiquinone/menaquinone biosynthesis C-methylase UbiE